MAKLLLLLAVLSVSSDYHVNAQLWSNMFGIGDIVRDIGGEINHVIQRFSGPNEKFVKDQKEKIKSIQKNLEENNKALTDIDQYADAVLEKLDIQDESQRELTRNLLVLNDTFTLLDLKIQLVLERINAITLQLEDIPISLSERTGVLLQNFANRLRGQRNLLDARETFKMYVRKIEILYNKFILYTQKSANLREDTMDGLISTILSFGPGELTNNLVQMNNLLAPGETASIYNGLYKFLQDYQSMQEFNDRCDLRSSYQEEYRELYKIVLLCEVKVFTMQVFGMNYNYAKGEETEGAVRFEVGKMIEGVLRRTSNYLNAMKITMAKASREIFRCEPKRHILDETSFRLNDLFGMYYISRKQLNPLVPTEPEEIDTLSYIECLNRYEYDDTFITYYCPRYQCAGRLHKCQTADSHKFCEARIGSNRRYVFDSHGNKFPNKPYDCRGRYIDTLSKTNDNLLCQCSEEGAESLATRAISLMPQISDIKNNMVVTNVRFVKKNNMVHLQIEEGLLMPEGDIDKSSISRVPLGNFRYDQNSPEGSYIQLHPEEWDDKIIRLVYDQDYTFLYHNRSTINLDDIVVDKGYVVTGVKFDTEENSPEEGINLSPIQLKVHGTPFDYITGLLAPTEKNPSKWFTPTHMKGKHRRYDYMREAVDISDVDDSIKNTAPVQGSPPNYKVTFQTTSWEKDMGQTVVPYFDALSAAVSNKVALDGIGIFHRGPKEGFGGFIAPKIYTIDHSQYINPEISEENIMKYKTAWITSQ